MFYFNVYEKNKNLPTVSLPLFTSQTPFLLVLVPCWYHYTLLCFFRTSYIECEHSQGQTVFPFQYFAKRGAFSSKTFTGKFPSLTRVSKQPFSLQEYFLNFREMRGDLLLQHTFCVLMHMHRFYLCSFR